MRESIEKLSEHIKSQPNLESGEKEELLGLLAGIEAETAEKLQAAGDEDCECPDHPAADLVRMTAAGVEQQSIPEQLDEGLLKLEVTYPKTAAALGRIAHVLSRMGI